MKKITSILLLNTLLLCSMAQIQNNPSAPPNPNLNIKHPNETQQNPNINMPQKPSGVTGITGATTIYPNDPASVPPPTYPTGATGYSLPTGNSGLSGEMNDQRNLNLDYNRQQRTGVTGPTGKKK